MKVEHPELFWSSLPVKVRNTLRRHKCNDPWNWTIKELIRIPGIKTGSITHIANSIQRYCL